MFCYYIPGTPRQVLKPEEARELGFGHAVEEGRTLKCVHTKKGPDGKAGLLAAADGFAGTLRFDDKKQLWRKHHSGRYWVGLSAEAKIAPEQLARKERFDGQLVKLADGNKWLIPRLVGVLAGRASSLPQRFDLAEDGEPILSVHEQYQDLSDRALKLWQEFIGEADGEQRLEAKERLRIATDALALNYRLDHLEAVALLRLLDTRSLNRVLRALIDADAIEEAMLSKGKAEGG